MAALATRRGKGTERRENPAVSPEQYRLAQAVLSGTARDTHMPKSVARELVERTPARLRSKWSRRGNPEGAAESMYASFHGVPSTVVDEYLEKEHYHSNLAALGELVGLKVRTVSGYDVTLGFETARAANPRRRTNLWPFDIFGKHTTIYHVGPREKKRTGKTKKEPTAKPVSRTVGEFRGQKIEKREQGFVAPGIDPDVYFDRKDDVKLFIASMLGGGKLKKNPLLEGREVRCRHNPKGKHHRPRVGPFTSSQQFVGDTVGAIYRPMNAAISTVGGMLDKGLSKVGLKGNKRKANPDHVLLCITEDGKNLQLVGGSQDIDLDALKIDGPLAEKELVTVGEVWGLNYFTEKVFGDGDSEDGQTQYIHVLGPKETKPPRGGDLWDDAVPPKDDVFGTGELPTLIYDKRNRKIILSGGMYFVNQPLMGTSPGLEN